MIPYILAAVGGYFIGEGLRKAKVMADGGSVPNTIYYLSKKRVKELKLNPDWYLENPNVVFGFRWNWGILPKTKRKELAIEAGVPSDIANKMAYEAQDSDDLMFEMGSEINRYTQKVAEYLKKNGIIETELGIGRPSAAVQESKRAMLKNRVKNLLNKKMADGGETYGEYAVRVRFTESDGSRHALVYDIEASDDEAAVKAAKDRLMEEFGPFSGIKYKDAEIIRVEEVPIFGDGGQTYKFTFKTTEEYDASRRGGYFDYDTVEVELEDPKIPFPLQPKSEEEFERIKATEKIKSVTPVRLWWDPMDIYDEPDQDDREEFDDRDEFSKGGKVDELVRDAFFAGGKSGYAAASKKDFATYEEWLKGKKIKHRGIYEAAFIAGGKSAFNMVKGRDGQTFEDFISTQKGFKRGGEVKFKDKVSSISKKLKGSKVPKRLQDDYGTTYDAEEAKEAAGRIAGSQLKKSLEKTEGTTKNDKFDSANAMRKPNSKNKTQPMPKSTTTKTPAKSAVKGEKIKLISAHAKKIWNKDQGEKWKDAIKRASVELKKQNKI